MSSRNWTLALLPLALFYLFFFVFSVLAFLSVSLNEHLSPGETGGGPTLSNFEDVLGNDFNRRVIIRTLRLGAYVAVISVAIAYPIAFVAARSRNLWGSIVFIATIGTLFSSVITRALGWKVLLATSGPINSTLMDVQIISEPLKLSDNFTGVVIGLVHAVLPFMILGLIPVIESLPRNVSDASCGLGASRWRTFWQVTFPLTRGGVISVSLLSFAIAASVFTTPLLLGGGRVAVLSLLIRQQTLQTLNFPLGAALAVVLVFIVFVVATLMLLLGGRQQRSGLS